MKYKFDHSKGTVSEGLGISDERFEEIKSAAEEICFRALFTDETVDDKVKALEIYINEVQPASVVEALFAGEAFGQMFVKVSRVAKSLSSVLAK